MKDMSKQEKVKEYINNRLNCKDCKYEGHCRFGAGYDGSEDCSCNGDDLAEAYEAGWDEALKSQWINVNDKLPATEEVVLALTSNGKISMAKMYQPKDCHGNDVGVVRWSGSSTFNNSIIA